MSINQYYILLLGTCESYTQDECNNLCHISGQKGELYYLETSTTCPQIYSCRCLIIPQQLTDEGGLYFCTLKELTFWKQIIK